MITYGFTASLLAGLCTSIGALGVFFVRKLSVRIENSLISFAAGIMLAASVFSLLLPGIEYGEQYFRSSQIAIWVVIAGLMLGAFALYLLNRKLPHEHFVMGKEGDAQTKLNRMWLFIFAIALHNFPEGMAVGVGFAGDDIANGISLAIGIGLQNIPEGLAVAVSMLAVGYSRLKGLAVGSLTGLAEPIGGLFGATAVTVAGPSMPLALAIAAGTMLYIISDEIIPETHRGDNQTLATFSLLVGFVIMMYLDITLG